ncbi:cytochrome P450 [Russula brevipes]|nr:cytochrome P450 [Russula brevipes]
MLDSFDSDVAFSRHILVLLARSLFVTVLSLFGAAAAYVLYIVACRRISVYRSPLQNLPGPKKAHWFKGNFVDVKEGDSSRLLEEWVGTYGHILKYYAVLGTPKLLAVDPVAVSYILQQHDTFQKSELVRFSLDTLTGHGKRSCLSLGISHFQLSHLQSPAFGPTQVRNFTPLFLEKSLELRDVWVDRLSNSTRKDGRLSLDVFRWLNKAALDIIGLAGFGYAFDSLHSPDDKQSELYEAIRSIMSTFNSFNSRNLFFVLQLFFPMMSLQPTSRSRIIDDAFVVIQRIGSQLIQDRKTAIFAEHSAGSGAVEKQDVSGHDLLSLLVRSNIAADMPENMRLSDSEILSQIPTFLLAGHETSSSAISWTLLALACHPSVQTKLRAELLTCPTDTPTMEQLNVLPYLEGVVREALRIYTPAAGTQRIAMRDAEIPLQKPFTDKHGVLRSTVRVSKGDLVVIPIQLLNRSTEIWGEDASEFRPERWEDAPEASKELPSIYGHLLTFIAGAHACIGYRFAVMEIKALLFTLVRAFEFELALLPEDIARRSGIIARPVLASNPAAGSRCHC